MSPLKLMIPALLVLGCATTPPAVPVEPDVQLTGTWKGAVTLPNGALTFVAHIAEDGTGTVDVPAQNARGLPLRVLRSEGDDFEMVSEVPGAPATLAGRREGERLRGTFSQRGHSFPFELRKETPRGERAAGVDSAMGLKGPWHGALVVGTQHIGVDVTFDAVGGGVLAVPSQGVRGLKVEALSLEGERISFHVTLPNGQAGGFDGALKADRIDGTYAQGGGHSPFFLQRGVRAAAKAAQSDAFTEQDVSFSHGDVTLSGTLTLPRHVSAPAVAVLISGSGPQDRDEEVAGFKVFEALAHALAKGGIATLRYDDRGIGRSTGDFHVATTHDFANDAEAAVRFLETRSDVDARRIGLMGHSEGAVVAPIVAARNGKVAFVVLLAPAAQPLGELVVDQIAPASRAEGLPAEKIEANQKLMRKVVSLLREGRDLSSLEAEFVASCAPACKAGDPSLTAFRKSLETPWFREFVKLDPAPHLSKVRVPMLAISGGLDVQVPADKNLPLLREIVARSKVKGSRVEEIDGINHLLQPAKTGAVSEYAGLPKVLEPRVAARIVEWIPGVTGVR